MQAGKNPEPRRYFEKVQGFNYQVDEYINLPKVQLSADPLFFETIINRKTGRKFKNLSLNQISNLLWFSAKTKKIMISETGSILSFRSSPSAGALHPIDILISLPVALEKRSLHYYDPFTHRLAKLKLISTQLYSFFESINTCLEINGATLIWFVTHPDRTNAKYKNGDSLVWRDAGALIMVIQLVATALNINSCPVGTLGEPFLSKHFGNRLFNAGGLLIG